MSGTRLKAQRGSLEQREHIDCASSHAGTEVLVPGDVKTADFAAAWELVGKECLVRVEVLADTYIAFADDATGGVVDAATSPAIKLPIGYHIIRATGPFMRASANPARVEVFF